MNRQNNLIPIMSRRYRIERGTTESVEQWQMRVIYSVLGQMAYASLWDKTEDDQPISVVHFKSRMKDLLENAGITLLNDKTVCINDSFYLVGRRDKSRARKVEDGRLSPEELLSSLDQSKPIFVLEHQPRQIEELAAAGADAHLCGHTHDGQLFPGNLLVAMMYKNAYGLKKFDQMYSVVTSGVGIWGPDMRVGTDSEIVELNVHFEN